MFFLLWHSQTRFSQTDISGKALNVVLISSGFVAKVIIYVVVPLSCIDA